ncbi:MAG: hypothetical protein ACE15C_20065 [Phycisphaerae bacterium]
MPTIDINPEELKERIIEDAAAQIVEQFDEGGLEDLQSRIRALMDKKIDESCLGVVTSLIERGIQALEFQITDRFGKTKEGPETLAEYVVTRADAWLNAHVDYQGKEQSPNCYGYKDSQTRLTWLIDQHLQYRIGNAMKDAVQRVITSVAPALAETCKVQITQAVADMTRKR